MRDQEHIDSWSELSLADVSRLVVMAQQCQDPGVFTELSGLPDDEAKNIYKFFQEQDRYISGGTFFPKKDQENPPRFKNVDSWLPVITECERLIRNGGRAQLAETLESLP